MGPWPELLAAPRLEKNTAANCLTALAQLPQVDHARIGVVGHSYGGKWAMFAACLDERFACAAWSDPGLVFGETRISINYWEPWYLGRDPRLTSAPGLISAQSPHIGTCAAMIATGRDLPELQALMVPRPFLVTGGSEDTVERWKTLAHAVAVNRVRGFEHRVSLHNRPKHDPTAESNTAIYRFSESVLQPPAVASPAPTGPAATPAAPATPPPSPRRARRARPRA